MRDFLKRAQIGWRENKAVCIIIVLILLLDRVSKRLTLEFLPGQDIELWPYLHLNYVQNTGAAFGMLQNGNVLFIVVALLIIGYILKNWKELCGYGTPVKWGLVFILGGALGNLYDRITLGFVVDFIDLRVWPVFNVADSFITVGGVLLACSLLTGKAKSAEEKK